MLRQWALHLTGGVLMTSVIPLFTHMLAGPEFIFVWRTCVDQAHTWPCSRPQHPEFHLMEVLFLLSFCLVRSVLFISAQ